MSYYLIPIEAAIIVFPILAFLITIPYALHQYQKYGAILGFRTVIIYSFVLYLLTLYFLVILPLPSITNVANLKTPIIQLIPFQFMIDFLTESGFLWNHITTYPNAFLDPSCYNVLFNLLMFVPFGIYLRYYFHCSFKKTILLSFLLSLFFELTQLTGLYGIYPRPYRLFDIDDLMINTLGGVFGFYFTKWLFFLPSRETLDDRSYEKGKQVSLTRRLFAFLFDFCLLLPFLWLIKWNQFLFLGFLYFTILPIITRGQTFGKWLVKIRMVDADLKQAKWYQYVIRYFLLYILTLNGPLLSFQLFTYLLQHHVWAILIFFPSIMGGIFLYFLLFFQFFFQHTNFFYEKISHTTQISTVLIPNKKKKQEKKMSIEEDDHNDTFW